MKNDIKIDYSVIIKDKEIADAIRTALSLGATEKEWKVFAEWIIKRREEWLDKCFQ